MSNRRPSVSDREAHTRQQLLGEEWWTTSFLSMMRSDHNSAQLVKGRRLAERGQVIIQSIYPGGVDAIILEALGGSRKVSLWVMDLDDDWEVVYRIFAEHQDLFSRLIAGDYPEELNDIFTEAGLFIIPTTVMDLDFRCDCNYHTICSHLIATYLALGRKINEDPMTLFLLRGKSREEILSGVSSIFEQDNQGENTIPSEIPESIEYVQETPDPSQFYGNISDLDQIRIRTRFIEGKENTIIRLLGPSPFKVGKQDLVSYIEAVYPKAVSFLIRKEENHSDDIRTFQEPAR